jgi:hypothetical protein
VGSEDGRPVRRDAGPKRAGLGVDHAAVSIAAGVVRRSFSPNRGNYFVFIDNQILVNNIQILVINIQILDEDLQILDNNIQIVDEDLQILDNNIQILDEDLQNVLNVIDRLNPLDNEG